MERRLTIDEALDFFERRQARKKEVDVKVFLEDGDEFNFEAILVGKTEKGYLICTGFLPDIVTDEFGVAEAVKGEDGKYYLPTTTDLVKVVYEREGRL